jgi:Papain family cysteine protease/Domain of unknown function (DUF4384)
MPIRMVEDEPGSSNSGRPQRSSGRSSGGFGGIGGNIIGALLPMLFRNPKILIVVIIIGALLYFFGGSSLFGDAQHSILSGFSQGANFDEKIYDEAEVFEPLSPEGNTLPERVSLEQFCPTPKNQGQQGSCVGWGSAYAARTILHARATGQDPDNIAFSPAFLYNQIKLDGCQGSYIQRAMDNMLSVGALPFSNFGYTDESCDREPSSDEKRTASAFKIKGGNRLTKNGDDYTIDMLAIKQNLAQGAPVVIGMMVGQSFMQPMMGEKIWTPSESDYSMQGLGGHCMCVIGYDDYIEGGAFQIMNSWGTEWGKNGMCYVRYADFMHFTKEAYGLYPMGEVSQPEPTQLDLDFGLVLNKSNTSVQFEKISDTKYSTSQLKVGDKFKVKIANNEECYIYIFGQETDNSSYVLFPYTPKHSPYCGITGTRLFPKDYSMEVDAVGTKDMIAVVVTKQPIDFNKMNQAINVASGNDYEAKLRSVLGPELSEFNSTLNKDGLKLSRSVAGKNAMFVVLEVKKG